MSKKCKAYSASKLGLEAPDTRKAFYAGWDAAIEAALTPGEPVAWMHTGGHVHVRNPQWPPKTAALYTAEKGWTPLYTAPPPQPQEAVQAYDSATHAAAMAVFMTRMDSEQPDADDKGVSGWLQEAEERIKLRASQTLSELVTTPQPQPKQEPAALTDEEKTELLDWVSACQSAYSLKQNPRGPFFALPGQLEENRQALVDYVNDLIAARAAPKPQREWVSLTDEEIGDIQRSSLVFSAYSSKAFARAIEALLRQKNGGGV